MRRSLAAFAVATACTGTDVGNPRVELGLTAYNAGAEVQAAWMVVERIRLRPASDCEGGAEVEVEGPLVIDLLAASPLAGIELEAGAYCRLEVEWQTLDGAPPADAPTELAGAAIVVTGPAEGGFVIRSERNDELRLEAGGDGFTLDEATGALFVAFDLAVWLDGIDFTSAEVGADGIIHIDDQDNSDLLDIFDDNVGDAADLFDDDDGDGSLDEDELTPL